MRIGNRVTEHDIRQWLDSNGFLGAIAKLAGPELHAMGRPGWVQVFRFGVEARRVDEVTPTPANEDQEADEPEENTSRFVGFGVVVDDERIRNEARRTQIWLFDNESEQLDKLAQVSEGIIQAGRKAPASVVLLAVAGLLSLLIAGLIASLSAQ